MGEKADASSLIGRRAIFHREKWRVNGHGVEKVIPYVGEILDKYRTLENKKEVDKYLVMCDNGAIDSFYPFELSQIL